MNTDVESAWPVGVLAALIALIAAFRGHFSDSLVVALVVFVLFGFLFPPAGILIGGLAVFYLLFVHGVDLFNQVGQLVGGKPAPPAAPAAAVGMKQRPL